MLSTGKKSEPMILTEPPIPTAASSSSAAPPSPPWIELPEDLTAYILQSQGQLVELKLFCYEADDFLNYVAERSNQLRSLALTEKDVFGTAFTKAIKKLPQLEELHFIKMHSVGPTDFEAIGISCPMLKSLTYSNTLNEHLEFTEHAVAIGKAMSNLSHLRLIGQRMENKGLEAILDGCPRLESLELQRCSGLDLQGALGIRCSEQIKDLRLHFEHSSASMGFLDWFMKQVEPDLEGLLLDDELW
ncbi:putative F-box/LRR-repeat protein 23 [Salvia divinorum]|uniref:F-box/LRR-repeat protein 23 n=1 Tax=Salvia divinorum TaxID=28513 RepID=A0ABD1HLG9_SALDI